MHQREDSIDHRLLLEACFLQGLQRLKSPRAHEDKFQINMASRSFPLLVSSSDRAFPLYSSDPLFSQQVKFFQPTEAVTSSFVSPSLLWPSWEAKYYFFLAQA